MLDRYKTRTSAAFDPAQPLVAGRRMTVQGVELNPGDPLPEDLEAGVKRRLWLIRRAHYNTDYRPTPVDESAPAAPGEASEALGEDAWMSDAQGVSVEKGAGGWYAVTAEWLEEPVRVRGEEAAKAKAEELRAEGPPPPADEAGDDTEE